MSQPLGYPNGRQALAEKCGKKRICASPALGKMKSGGGPPKSRVSARPDNTPDEAEVCSAPPLASAVIEQDATFVVIFDAGLRPVLLNRAGRQMVGLDAGADISNFALRDFFTLEHGRILDEVVLPELLRHGHWNGDLRLRHFEEPAVEVAVHWSSFALLDEGGALIGAAMISSDNSEHRAAQRELRQSRSLLAAIIGDLPLGLKAYDRSGTLLTGNDEFRQMKDVTALPSIDPAGDGRYDIECRVFGKSGGVERCVATSGQATFARGRATGFIGAAVDVTDERRVEAAIRDSEERFLSFAGHTTNLLWIVDPAKDVVEYRSPAYERISGEPTGPDPMPLTQWLAWVHPEDQAQVLAALESVKSGHAMQFDYRVVRSDGLVRWLRDTSFPIRDEAGRVVRIGGIAANLTRPDGHQVYLVGAGAKRSRELAGTVRGLGLQVRSFATAEVFLDIAPVLARGCVLVDLRGTGHDPTALPRELQARAIPLPCVLIGSTDAAADAVAAMKAGAADYLLPTFDGATLKAALKLAIAKVHEPAGFQAAAEEAVARVARLTKREREVLVGLVEGGTNKVIGKKLGISPRTVELHRAQVMHRLNAASLPELVQLALAAGIRPAADPIPAGRQGSRTPT